MCVFCLVRLVENEDETSVSEMPSVGYRADDDLAQALGMPLAHLVADRTLEKTSSPSTSDIDVSSCDSDHDETHLKMG